MLHNFCSFISRVYYPKSLGCCQSNIMIKWYWLQKMIQLQLHLFKTILSYSYQVSSFLFYIFKCSTITADSPEDCSDSIVLNLNRKIQKLWNIRCNCKFWIMRTLGRIEFMQSKLIREGDNNYAEQLSVTNEGNNGSPRH